MHEHHHIFWVVVLSALATALTVGLVRANQSHDPAPTPINSPAVRPIGPAFPTTPQQ